MILKRAMLWCVLTILVGTGPLWASNWPGFRGPGSRGASDETGLPMTWSDTENLAWKCSLPGPGSSSPIVWGDRVFVTCYSGYGLDPNGAGDPNDLKRHLVCIQAEDGRVLWDRAVPAVPREIIYRGFLREHGYASQTPVTDGQRVYVFFGKTGILAFDMKGHQLWQTSVGTESDTKRWGSATSLALNEDMVFVNAWDESKTVYALNKETGQEVWKKNFPEKALSFSTPVLVDRDSGQDVLIASVPSHIWGLNPADGNVLWFVRTGIADDMIPTPLVVDDVVYIHGGGPRQHGSLAFRLGGRGDVTETHILWTSKTVGSPPSPVLVDGSLYAIHAAGPIYCMDPATGELRFRDKLPVDDRFAMYGSPVAAEGRIYFVTRKAGTFVLAPKPKPDDPAAEPGFEILAHNQLASDESDFNASPAIANKSLYLRSNKNLYRIKAQP